MNIFLGKSQSWLEAELAKAQADAAAGKITIRVSTPGVSADKMQEMSIISRIEQLLWALNALDPTTYPAASIKRITRTKAVFS